MSQNEPKDDNKHGKNKGEREEIPEPGPPARPPIPPQRLIGESPCLNLIFKQIYGRKPFFEQKVVFGQLIVHLKRGLFIEF